MIDFSELIENFSDFLSERKKGVLISCILVLFFCAGLIVMAFIPEKEKAIDNAYQAEPYTPDQELVLPQGPSIPQSYTVTRESSDKWETEEIEKWLTKPDTAAVEKLSNANDKMISDIMGAAP